MKTNILLFIAITALTAYATYIIDHNMNTRPQLVSMPQEIIRDLNGQQVPTFTFTDTNGQTHNINDFEGKIVLLNFWASWCPPCLKEFPDFIKAANAFPDDIIIIALSSDIAPAQMNKFLDKMKATHKEKFPTANILTSFDKDAQTTQNLFGALKLPETIIIDRNGKMQERLLGANWHYKQLEEKINILK